MMMYIVMLLMLFEGAISKIGFTYLDEIILLLLGIHAVLVIYRRKPKRHINKYERRFALTIAVFYVLGVISTIVYNYQGDVIFGLASGFFSCKFFLAYIVMRYNKVVGQFDSRKLYKACKLIENLLIVSSVLLLFDQVYAIFPYTYARFNFHSSTYIFNTPTEVAGYASISLMIIIFIRRSLQKKIRAYRNFLPALVCIVCTGRYKAISFIIIFFFLVEWMNIVKKIKIWHFIFILPLAYLFVRSQIAVYIDPSEARYNLYYGAFRIANDHFPLGSGFATFATQFSRDRYSPLYSQYGMTAIYGMSKSFSAYLLDAQWPSIIGETGWMGLGTIFIAIFFLVKNIVTTLRKDKTYVVAIAILVYLLIETTAETIFMSSRGVTTGFLLALIINYKNRSDRDRSKLKSLKYEG